MIQLPNFDPNTVDVRAQLLDIDRADCEESLYFFMKSAWRYIDPAIWQDSWAVDAICQHLQALVDGEIQRLIINVPPRIGKSNACSVVFPAWVWAQTERTVTSGPGVPLLYASYNDSLSKRDSVKCRRLIESPWYQERWGSRFKLNSDQNTKSRFSNDQGGERLITSIGAGVTGEGGNIIVADDPNSATDMASEAALESCIEWWTSAMPSRANNPALAAWLIIQQRLGENDLTGHVTSTEADQWVHLMLPARYEPERSYFTPIGWKDPRTEVGELLWPERFSEAVLEGYMKRMGPHIFAGQMQQRPEPKGGGIIKRDWWQEWKRPQYPAFDYILACLDTAYTKDTMNDPSGMIIWGVFSDERAQRTRVVGSNGELIELASSYTEFAPKVMMIHAWDEHLEFHELVERVDKECRDFKVDDLKIENKASGISVAQEIRRVYARAKYGVQMFDPKSQDKTARLYSVQHLFADGTVCAPNRPWVDRVIEQVGQFPKGKHDEYADLVSMGLRTLRDAGLLIRQPEREAEIESEKAYAGRVQSLYEC